MEWISIKEKLPERNREVLVFHYAGWFDIDKIEFIWDNGTGSFKENGDGITHWMELPKAPIEFCKNCQNQKIACVCLKDEDLED